MCLSSNYKHVWWRFPCICTNTNVALWLRTSMDKPTIIIDSWTAGAWYSQFESSAKRPSFSGPGSDLTWTILCSSAAWSPPLWFSGACWPATTLFFDYEHPDWGCSMDLFWRFAFCKRRDSYRFIACLSGKKSKENVWKQEKKSPVSYSRMGQSFFFTSGSNWLQHKASNQRNNHNIRKL